MGLWEPWFHLSQMLIHLYYLPFTLISTLLAPYQSFCASSIHLTVGFPTFFLPWDCLYRILFSTFVQSIIIHASTTLSFFWYLLPDHRDSSVSIAMDYRLDGQSLIPSRGKVFLYFIVSRPPLGPTHPPIQWELGAISWEVKWLGCEVDHSPACSAKVNILSSTITSPYTFMVWYLIKHRHSFTTWPDQGFYVNSLGILQTLVQLLVHTPSSEFSCPRYLT
jgi:hypothetical protein